MERLTERSKNTSMVWFKDNENSNMLLEPCEMSSHNSRMAIEKLATYEDAEEQGLLLRLPCKVGEPPKQTNADRIRSMTDEELAIHMMCPNEMGAAEIECDKSDSCNCYECLLNWLRAESEG